MEDVGWRAVVAGHARWRGLGGGQGVVRQTGLDGQREVRGRGCGRDGGGGLGGEGQTVSPQGLQAQLGGGVEGVEVEWLVDVLIFSFGLAVGRAVVAWIVQGVDLAVFTPRDKRVLLDRIQVFCSTGLRKGKWRSRHAGSKRGGKGIKKRLRQIKTEDSRK